MCVYAGYLMYEKNAYLALMFFKEFFLLLMLADVIDTKKVLLQP